MEDAGDEVESEAGELLIRVDNCKGIPKMDFSLTSNGVCDPCVIS